MKKLAKIILITIALFTASCKKEPEDRIPGDWKVLLTAETSITDPEGVVDEDVEKSVGKATFADEGTGKLEIRGAIIAFIWFASGSQVTLQFLEDQLIFEVLENKRKKQVWEYILEDSNYGYQVKQIVTVELTK